MFTWYATYLQSIVVYFLPLFEKMVEVIIPTIISSYLYSKIFWEILSTD